MGKHTPIDLQWVLARPKLKDGVKYYGSYPAGALHRMRYLLGVQGDDPVLHVCSGVVDRHVFRGFGPNDMTVDLDPGVNPDWVMDVRKDLPRCPHDPQGWKAILADPPYSPKDAENYLGGRGHNFYPNPAKLLRLMFERVRPGGRVGFLHYIWPAPPTGKAPGVKSRVSGITRVIDGQEVFLRIHQVACVGMVVGYRNRNRVYGVWELGLPETVSQEKPALSQIRKGSWVIR